MKKDDLELLRKWFLDYTAQFFSSDPFIQKNFDLKTEHTKRVCQNILLLAKAQGIGEEKCRLAETIALFHDLGRFEQFLKYKTFYDSESENHALLSLKILEKAEILASFPLAEKNIILKAIEYHNLIEIPILEYDESLEDSRELLFYSRLIRDADKLDILKLVSQDCKEKERNPALEYSLPDTPGCAQAIIADILENRMAKIGDVKNRNDMKLLRLSWVFDINFLATFVILKQEGYLDIILSSISDVEEICLIKTHIKKYLDQAKGSLEIKNNQRKIRLINNTEPENKQGITT